MNITVKRIGYNIGTVGWLAQGLEDGSITIFEGVTQQSKHHGLWIESKASKDILAVFNQYGLTAGEYENADQYCLYDYAEKGGRENLYTPACWETLENIAQQWCDGCNAERERDTSTEVKIRRVELQGGNNNG
ncbi:MAG: hypothetical protein WC623_24130 [Pedobacter sp.]|uniref:hypothetical protein n=1 Tax=Pedobacter sp. TaxID=1411316 RepID=UPI003569C509